MSKLTRTIRVLRGHDGARIKILSDNSIRYRYRVSPDITCDFSLWCEVGEPYKPLFVDILNKHGLRVADGHIELPISPWLSDSLEVTS